MKLSICIPTYNRFEALKKQINYFIEEGIINYNDVEFIISDNASIDNTPYYLNQLKKIYPRIIINSNQENIGAERNFLKLIEMARGEYIWLVGDDDQILSGALDDILTTLNSRLNISWLFIKHDILYPDNKIVSYKLEVSEYYLDGLELFKRILCSDYKLGALMFISASIHKTENIKEAVNFYFHSVEVINENKALPLGLAYYSALSGSACATTKTYIIDNVVNVDWSCYAKKIFCRDQIAILDLFSQYRGVKLLECVDFKPGLMYKNPEWVYVKTKFKQDNYAMKFYFKNKPIQIVVDLFDVIKNKFIGKVINK